MPKYYRDSTNAAAQTVFNALCVSARKAVTDGSPERAVRLLNLAGALDIEFDIDNEAVPGMHLPKTYGGYV